MTTSDTPAPTFLAIGTETEQGVVQAVGFTGGERYYWLQDKNGTVKMIPAFMLEEEI